MFFNAYDNSAGQAWSCVILCLWLATWLHYRPAPVGFWRRGVLPLACIGAALLWGIVATLVVGDGTLPDYTPGKVASIVAGLAALVIGATERVDQGDVRRPLDRLLLVQCVALLLGLALFGLATPDIDYWHVVRLGRFQGLAGNANVTAAIAGAMAILAFSRVLDHLSLPGGVRARPLWLGFYGAAFVLAETVVVFTATRTANALTLALLAVLTLGFLRRNRGTRIARPLWVAVGVLGLVAVAQASGLLGQRFGALGLGWDNRTDLWGHCFDLALNQPLFGYGLGSFPSVNAHFLGDPQFARANWAVNSPHNILLQLALGAGFPYLVALLAAAAAILVPFARAARDRPARDETTVALMLVLIMCSAMVDVVMDMPGSLVVVLYLVGLLWGRRLSGDRTPDRDAVSRPSGAGTRDSRRRRVPRA